MRDCGRLLRRGRGVLKKPRSSLMPSVTRRIIGSSRARCKSGAVLCMGGSKQQIGRASW